MLNIFKIKLAKEHELYLRIKVHPGSSLTGVKEILSDSTVKININAPAEKGKANSALLEYLAREFGVNKNEVKIISGAAEKLKLVKIVKI